MKAITTIALNPITLNAIKQVLSVPNKRSTVEGEAYIKLENGLLSAINKTITFSSKLDGVGKSGPHYINYVSLSNLLQASGDSLEIKEDSISLESAQYGLIQEGLSVTKDPWKGLDKNIAVGKPAFTVDIDLATLKYFFKQGYSNGKVIELKLINKQLRLVTQIANSTYLQAILKQNIPYDKEFSYGLTNVELGYVNKLNGGKDEVATIGFYEKPDCLAIQTKNDNLTIALGESVDELNVVSTYLNLPALVSTEVEANTWKNAVRFQTYKVDTKDEVVFQVKEKTITIKGSHTSTEATIAQVEKEKTSPVKYYPKDLIETCKVITNDKFILSYKEHQPSSGSGVLNILGTVQETELMTIKTCTTDME